MTKPKKLTDERLDELAKIRRSPHTRFLYEARDDEIRSMARELIWMRAAVKPQPQSN